MPLICFQTGASLQQKADSWKEKVNETGGSKSITTNHLDQEVQVLALYLVELIILSTEDINLILVSNKCDGL